MTQDSIKAFVREKAKQVEQVEKKTDRQRVRCFPLRLNALMRSVFSV